MRPNRWIVLGNSAYAFDSEGAMIEAPVIQSRPEWQYAERIDLSPNSEDFTVNTVALLYMLLELSQKQTGGSK